MYCHRLRVSDCVLRIGCYNEWIAGGVCPLPTIFLSCDNAMINPDLLDLYRRMLLLRRFELTAQDLYRRGSIPGFIHLYVGEEAVAVGVCAHLNRADYITSTHRGHGHALA